MNNQLAKSMNINQYLDKPEVTSRLIEKFDAQEAKRFKAALSSAVTTNPMLLQCDPASVVNGALVGHSLDLPMSPQLGYYYLVPYNIKKKGCKEAQFQIGYKGYIQLAMRSGYYKRLNVSTVKDGEFVSWNPLTEELEVNFGEDPVKREELPTVGYCGYFEYTNGFKKMVYWTITAVKSHADKYSKAYSAKTHDNLKAGKIPVSEAWKYSSFWYKDFDAMAMKTVLRQMLSKWGAMSVDMTTAFEKDIDNEYTSFGQAQQDAQTTIDNESGTEVVDASFEDAQKPEDPVIDESFLDD